MVRLPAPQFQRLCGNAEPQVFGLGYAPSEGSSYDGGIHLSVTDIHRLQQTLNALQESLTPGNRPHVELHWRLERMLTAPLKSVTVGEGDNTERRGSQTGFGTLG